MALFNIFPYTNFHDLNMDWIINKLKNIMNTAVFTVNNTTPVNGNVNLPQVSGMSSVNGIGADGNGNVSIVAKPALVYNTLQSADFSAHVNNATGTVCWRSGVASIITTFTVEAGTAYGDEILTLPANIPEKCGSVILYGWDSNGNMHKFGIAVGNNKVVTREAFAEDTTIIDLYHTWLTYPDFNITITSP